MYGDWMAPAGAVVVGAEAGAAGVEAYTRNQHEANIPQTYEQTPEVPEKSEVRSSTAEMDNVAAFGVNTSKAQPETSQPTRSDSAKAPVVFASTSASDNLGGLESQGAHETGAVFPKVVRRDTEMLHVPGEYPKKT